MKLFFYTFMCTALMTGCQSIQFAESPIPVTAGFTSTISDR